VVALQGKIYVLGGFAAQRGEVAEVLVYDPALDSWDFSEPLPLPAHHINASVVDDKIYVTGCLRGNGFAAAGLTWEYESGVGWTEKAPMRAGSERGASTVGVIGGKIYVAGGYRGGRSVADVSAYDPVADRWEVDLAPLPQARDHLAGGSVGGYLYATSGRENGLYNLTARTERYDPLLDEWTDMAPMPTPRAGVAAGVVQGRLVVVGGEGNASADNGVFDEVEAFDPELNQWFSLAAMTTPRHGMGGAAIGNFFYVPGGATRAGFGAVDTHEVLEIP
jgi:N-acetylneuraminic acid mutarotase